MMKKFSVTLYWQACAKIIVEAPNKQEAAQIAMNGNLPPSNKWEYVPDSENVDEDTIVEV